MRRCLIGKTTLDKAVAMHRQRYTTTVIAKLLEIDKYMHPKTAYNIIRADRQKLYHITRPEWLEDDMIDGKLDLSLMVQQAPDGWFLEGDMRTGKWVFDGDSE